MAFTNYNFTTLRASSATGAGVTSWQEAAVTIPETVHDFWAVLAKTAEDDPDNLLTVRLQCKIGSNWYDMSRASVQSTVAVTTAADTATVVTRGANIVESNSSATLSTVQYYDTVPSNVIRVAWIASSAGAPGTVSHTFSVIAAHMLNEL